ncbi:MAG: imidazoleglycerol-phosphate dehydratase HisB [Dictyoglomus sp.]
MRRAEIERETKETYVRVNLNIDGNGNFTGDFPIPYYKHLISTLCFYAGWNLNISAKGDIEVDFHHLVEDTGIVLGRAFLEAIKNSKFRRFSHKIIPMDEALVMVAVDISGRSFLVFRDDNEILKGSLIKEFLRGFVNNAQFTLHIWILSGENIHHTEEAIFKALGLALKEAGAENKDDNSMSTKGRIW